MAKKKSRAKKSPAIKNRSSSTSCSENSKEKNISNQIQFDSDPPLRSVSATTAQIQSKSYAQAAGSPSVKQIAPSSVSVHAAPCPSAQFKQDIRSRPPSSAASETPPPAKALPDSSGNSPDRTVTMKASHLSASMEEDLPQKIQPPVESVITSTDVISKRMSWKEVVHGSKTKLSKKEEDFLLESGEKCVEMPNDVIIENQHRWKDFIIGQFLGKPPSPGTLFAIVNGIWSNKNRDITVSKVSPRAFLIKIPSDSTRKRVLEQGMWHIEKQAMFVAKWEPGLEPQIPELTAVPVWIDFHNVPLQCYSEPALERIASMVGDPVILHPNTANMSNLEVARVLTIIDPRKPLPEAVNVRFQSGRVVRVLVSSPWIPPICEFCDEVGHSIRRCPTAPVSCQECKSTAHSQANCHKLKEKTTVKNTIILRKRSNSRTSSKETWVEKEKSKPADSNVDIGPSRLQNTKDSVETKRQSNRAEGKSIAYSSSSESSGIPDSISSGISDLPESSDSDSPSYTSDEDDNTREELNFEKVLSKRSKKKAHQIEGRSVVKQNSTSRSKQVPKSVGQRSSRKDF